MIRKIKFFGLNAGLLMAGLFGQTATGAILTTTNGWNGTSAFGSLMGEEPSVPATVSTYGQTFSPPSATPVLKTFTFWMSDSPVFHPNPVRFSGYLMRWDLLGARGPILYQSGSRFVPTKVHGEFARVDFDVNVLLSPGQQYVFFVSSAGYLDGTDSTAYMSGVAANPYPFGAMVSAQGNWTMETLGNLKWDSTSQSWDTIFLASFEPANVPEPRTMAIFGTAAVMMALIRRQVKTRALDD